MTGKNNYRDTAVVAMRREGMTLQDIGTRTGLTRERIRQICVEREAEEEKRKTRSGLLPENTPIHLFEAPVRVLRAVREVHLRTLRPPVRSVRDLAMFTEADFLCLHNFGSTSLGELKCALAKFNISLKETPPRSFPKVFDGI